MPRGGGAIGPDFRRTDVQSPEPICVSHQLKHSKANQYCHLPIASPSAKVGMWNARGLECRAQVRHHALGKSCRTQPRAAMCSSDLMFGGRHLKCG
jgi:hypothetical protein